MTPDPTNNIFFQAAEHFGFPVAMVACLIFFGWVWGRAITAELGRLTRAVTLAVLAMSFAPQFHKDARELYHESMRAARARKEDLDEEIGKEREK